MEEIIRADSVGKQYRRNGELFWALKDVSFSIEQGESVGVVGVNGAGKSTLLKIVSGVTRPTTGYVDVWGRATPLLEVGTGFHPELTGRENAYLNGIILGMSKADVTDQLEDIFKFAELGDAADTPVKHYSSGMFARLAFAVATHLKSEIILVDEIISVGDIHFRKKCYDKIVEMRDSGQTFFYVSHDLPSVRTICSRGIWIDKGEKILDTDVDTAVDMYTQHGGGE